MYQTQWPEAAKDFQHISCWTSTRLPRVIRVYPSILTSLLYYWKCYQKYKMLTKSTSVHFRLVETTLIRRHGYVFRLEYEGFLDRYKMLSNQTWPHWSGDGSVDGVTCLLRDLPISANEYAFGRTKIYIRTSKTVSSIPSFSIWIHEGRHILRKKFPEQQSGGR